MKYCIFFLVLLAGWGLSNCSGNKKQVEEQTGSALPVSLARVEKAVRADPVKTAGTVASLSEARLAFKIGGVIEKVYVREGESVRAGQLLATLNTTEIDAQVGQAELAFQKSGRDFERVKSMLRDTAATLEQFQNAGTALDIAQQNVSIARFNRDFAKISSPVSGTVVKKLMSEGEVAGPGTPVLVLVSSRKSDWVVKAGVSDRDWARLKPGDKAEVELDAYPGEIFPGTVTFLSQAADPMTHLYEVEVKLTGLPSRLASGLFAKIALWPSQRREYSVIPVEALLEGHGQEGFVFVAKSGKARKIPVKIGYLDQDKVLLTGGLDSVDQVITGGSAFLVDGAAVRVP